MRSCFLPYATVLVAALAGCGKAGGSGSASVEPESASKSKTTEVKLSVHWPAAGDKVTTISSSDTETYSDLRADGESAKHNETEHESSEKIEECVETGDKVCKKLKVTFTKWEKTKTRDGNEKKKEGPILNRVYIVEGKDGKRTVTAEDGKELSDEEMRELKSYTKPNKSRAFLEALPTNKPIKVGDSLDGLSDVLIEQITGVAENNKLKPTAKIVVKEINDKIVVLDVSITMDETNEKLGTMNGETKGTIEVRADGGVPVRTELSGPLTVELARGAGTIKSKTTMKSVATYSW